MQKWVILCIISFFPFIGPATAADTDYVVSNVIVDQQANNAIEARKKAIENAQIQAFYRLILRLSPNYSEEKLHRVKPHRIFQMVEGFEVLEEKITANRYRANMRVSFFPSYIRNFLGKYRFQKRVSSNILVLPLYYDLMANQSSLWQRNNPWRHAWNSARLRRDNIQFVIPLGDLEDISLTANAAKAWSEDKAAPYFAFQPLLEKYDACCLLIAKAEHTKELEETDALQVTLTELSRGVTEKSFAHYTNSRHIDYDAFLATAVRDVVSRQERSFGKKLSKENRVVASPSFVVPIDSLGDWTVMRNRLEELPFIDNIQVMTLTTDKVIIQIEFTQNSHNFISLFKQHHMDIEVVDGSYILRAKQSFLKRIF